MKKLILIFSVVIAIGTLQWANADVSRITKLSNMPTTDWTSAHTWVAGESTGVNNLHIWANIDSTLVNLLRIWAEGDSVRTNLLANWAAADTANYNTAYVQSLTELLDADFGSAGIMETDGAGTYSIVTAIDGIPIGGTTPAAGYFTTLEADTLFISGGNTTYYWAVEHGVTTYGVYK